MKTSGIVSVVVSCLCFAALLYLRKTASDPQLEEVAAIGVAVGLLGFFAVWGLLEAVHATQAAAEDRELESRGVEVEATVENVAQTGGATNNQPQLQVTLQFDLPSGHHVVTHCQVVQMLHLSRVQPDHLVRVRVLPDRPEVLRLVFA